VTTAFVDSNVPLYAAGSASPGRDPCRRVLKAVAAGEIDAWTNVQVLQELLHRCLQATRRGRPEALTVFDDFVALFTGRVIAVEPADLERARELTSDHGALPAADLVHLATMERHGLTAIVTADRHFDGLAEVERLDPAALARRLRRS
jgi:hypothetical protein